MLEYDPASLCAPRARSTLASSPASVASRSAIATLAEVSVDEIVWAALRCHVAVMFCERDDAHVHVLQYAMMSPPLRTARSNCAFDGIRRAFIRRAL